MRKLDNKVALITGGTTGIGFESARVFLQEDATVVLTGANPENTAAAQTALGEGADVLRSNGADVAQIDALVAHVHERYGCLDVLFVNAGTGSQRLIELVDEAYFDNMVALNVRGLYFMVQRASPPMSAGGSIILTASVAAHVGAVGGTVYAATKAAVRSLGRSFGAELAPRGIRVDTLTPGPIDTPLVGKSGVPAEMMPWVALARPRKPQRPCFPRFRRRFFHPRPVRSGSLAV